MVNGGLWKPLIFFSALSFYLGLVVLLMVGVVVIGSLALSSLGSVGAITEKVWAESTLDVRQYFLQEFHCCGFNAPDNTTLCLNATKQDPKIEGCRVKLIEWVTGHITTVLIVVLPIVILLVIGLALTCFLICAIPSSQTKMEQDALMDHIAQYRNYH
eukprot:TRINITY_DN1091_c0_g2_i5.p1 TRINITY_DN1091_c0_g2~~TRINITY_DN1091_c0_g2_i5.p1  ORF type:complete len:158 (-),score=23.85 TRINITY_DN1091_c0_g2_i5:130-603(-)